MPETIFGIQPLTFLWSVVIVVFFIGMIIFSIQKNKKVHMEKKNFLRAHPNASKIYEMTKGVITFNTVEIHAIDGQPPIALWEIGKNGVWIAPGEHIIMVSFSRTRQGVVYDSIKSTGTVEKAVNIEPNTEYELTFDPKEGTFALREIGKVTKSK